MRKEKKKEVIEEMTAKLKGQKNLIIVDFSGIKANDMASFRKGLKNENIFYRVVKGNLLKLAFKNAGFTLDDSIFEGPVGVAIHENEPVVLSKKFVDFKDEDDKLLFKVKTGLIDGEWVSKEDIERIAELPSKDELYSKLVYLLESPIQRLVTVLQKPTRDFVVVLDQVKNKKEEAGKAA
ncbi:MAG: 50S ribosomal protein L10 [Nitrospiraceae bacterium]|nr:50S ribosomal protein L10 [Nitrospiraceae bacterium]